jgi:hypothetical protein
VPFVIEEPIFISRNTIFTGDTSAKIKLKDGVAWWTYNKPIITQKNRIMPWSPWGNVGENISNVEIFGFEIDGGIHLGSVANIATYPINSRIDVHIHHNTIYKVNDALTQGTNLSLDDGIKINGFQNTLIEHNIIDGGTTDGIVYEGVSGGSSGYQTFVRNNIIINNDGYGINNNEPSKHSFIANNNLVYNNLAENYNNATPTNDINVAPKFAKTHSTLNQWYHIVANYDNASETFKIYVNGVEKTSETIPSFGLIGTNAFNTLIGTIYNLNYSFS